MRHELWLCDCLHLPQWMVKFHSSYELTEKDYQDGPKHGPPRGDGCMGQELPQGLSESRVIPMLV
jgi:hypothetical protein